MFDLRWQGKAKTNQNHLIEKLPTCHHSVYRKCTTVHSRYVYHILAVNHPFQHLVVKKE